MKLICTKCHKSFTTSPMDDATIKHLLSPHTIHVDLANFLCIDCYINEYATTDELKSQRCNLNLDIDKIEE